MFSKLFNSLKLFLLGLSKVLVHLFKRPVTREYPEIKPILNQYFRGQHTLENCKACGYCQKVCPSDAITIYKLDGYLDKFIVDYTKCIFCGNCIYYCPSKAIKMSDVFELAESDKAKLIFEVDN